jgi:hypothetical protein
MLGWVGFCWTRISSEHNLDMHTLMSIISEEATAILYSKPTSTRNPDCEEEVALILADRQLSIIQNNTEETTRLTKLLKKTARKLKTYKMIAKFVEDKWDPIKLYKKKVTFQNTLS